MILQYSTAALCLLVTIQSSNGQFGIGSLGVGSPTNFPPSRGSFRSPLLSSASAPSPYGPYGPPSSGYSPQYPASIQYSPYTTTFSSPPQYSAQLAPPFQSSNQPFNSNSGNNNNNGGSSSNNNSNGGLFGGGRLLSRIFPNRGEGENRGLLGLGSNRGSLLSRLRGTSNNNNNNNNGGNNNPVNQNFPQLPPMSPGYGYNYNPYALGAQQLQAQVHLFPPSHPSHGMHPPPSMGHHHHPPPPPPGYDGPDDGPDGPPPGVLNAYRAASQSGSSLFHS